MPVYRVYYATEENKRTFTPHDYITIYGTDRIEAYRAAFELLHSAIKWGMIEEFVTFTPDCDTCGDTGWCCPHDCGCPYELMPCIHPDEYPCPDCYQPKHRPKPAASATLAPVQVSWWQSGARRGLFSQMQYEVLSQDETWVTVSLMGKPKAVRREYTRSAAA